MDSQKHKLNIMEIDLQHADFVKLAEDARETIESYPEQEEIEKIFQKLFDYADTHFTTEEKYFEEFKYEGAKEHVEEHRKAMEKLKSFKERYNKRKSLVILGELLEFLSAWLVTHIMNYDSKYKECFQKHGVK